MKQNTTKGNEDANKTELANLDNFTLPKGNMEWNTRSFTLYDVMDNVDEGTWVVPKDFQRDQIYSDAQKVSLLETLILTKPIPTLVLFEDTKNNPGVYAIVDGQQRVTSIHDVLSGEIPLRFFDESISDLNGYTFDELPQKIQNKIQNIHIDVQILRGVDKEEIQRYYTLLNSTSVPLTPGEIMYAIPDPVHKYFQQAHDMAILNKITSGRRKLKWYIVAKLFYQMEEGDLAHHKYIGNPRIDMRNFFNSVPEHHISKLWNDVRHLLNTVQNHIGDCALPRGGYQIFNWICAIGTINETQKIDEVRLQAVLNKALECMLTPKISPSGYRDCVEILASNKAESSPTKTNEFVKAFEQLYAAGEKFYDAGDKSISLKGGVHNGQHISSSA